MKKKLVIYTATIKEWEQIQKHETFSSGSLSIEGFIHCSFAEQTVWVANKHYHGEASIMLLCIDQDLLESELRIEDLKGRGETFPHVYGEINTSAIVKSFLLRKSEEGQYAVSEELQEIISSEE